MAMQSAVENVPGHLRSSKCLPDQTKANAWLRPAL
jgi:hypothetical protein